MLKVVSSIQTILLITFIVFGSFAVAKKAVVVSLEEATKNIQNSSKGKILSAKTTSNLNGTSTHKIKILTPSGRVKLYKVPDGKPAKLSNRRNYRMRNSNQNHNNRSMDNNSYRHNSNSSTKISKSARETKQK